MPGDVIDIYGNPILNSTGMPAELPPGEAAAKAAILRGQMPDDQAPLSVEDVKRAAFGYPRDCYLVAAGSHYARDPKTDWIVIEAMEEIFADAGWLGRGEKQAHDLGQYNFIRAPGQDEGEFRKLRARLDRLATNGPAYARDRIRDRKTGMIFEE